MTGMKLKEIAEKVGGRIDGNGEVNITGVAGLLEAKPGDISFVDNPKYVAQITKSFASALIVHVDLSTEFRPLIRSENPYLSFTRAMELLVASRDRLEPGIHPSAVVSSQARISDQATIMANVVVEAEVVVEDRAVIYPGVIIGKGSKILQDVLIYPNASISAGSFIGERVIIHSGVILGSRSQESAMDSPMPGVEIGADVELGANTTIVAGVRRPTRIKRGTKVDNLVHIDHDVEIGEDAVIVAMVTIEPEASIGQEVTLTGQVGVKRGVSIGRRSVIGARSVVVDDVPEGKKYSGVPAISHSQEKRVKAALVRLPKLYKRVQHIEEQINGPSENS